MTGLSGLLKRKGLSIMIEEVETIMLFRSFGLFSTPCQQVVRHCMPIIPLLEILKSHLSCPGYPGKLDIGRRIKSPKCVMAHLHCGFTCIS